MAHTRSPGGRVQQHQQHQQHPHQPQPVQAVMQAAPFASSTCVASASSGREVKHRISNPSLGGLGGAASPRAETGHPGPPGSGSGSSSSSNSAGAGGGTHWGPHGSLPPYTSPQPQAHHHLHPSPHAGSGYGPGGAAAGGGGPPGLLGGVQQQQQQFYSKLGGKPSGLLHRAAERLRQQRGYLASTHVLRRAALWGLAGVVVLLVLTSLAPGPQEEAQPATDVLLRLGPYFFNPSIVRHRGVYLSTARTAHMKRIDRTNWWFNEGYVCMSTTADFKTVSCRKFDPWQGRFQECLWGSERKVADVDTQGVEDPKLFVWPGKGVFAVFGRKPEALGASPYCKDPIFVQFVVQVIAENAADDAWSIHRPTELKPGIFAPQLYTTRKSREPIKEKNWMPFVWSDQLFMVHSVFPQRVFRVNASGVAVQQWVTTAPSLFEPYKDEDIHGGPPLIHVPAHLSGTGRDYLLGVFHFFKTFGEGVHKVKVYHHYAYRVEAEPPFRVCGVSREIQLVTRQRTKDKSKAADWTHQRIWKDTSQTAYIAGLYLDGARVHLSYGSSDIDARLLSMSVAELEALFDGGHAGFECSHSKVLDNGSGQPMEPLGGGLAAQGLTQEAGGLLLGSDGGSDSGGGGASRSTAAAASAVAAAAGSAAGRSSLQTTSGLAAVAAVRSTLNASSAARGTAGNVGGELLAAAGGLAATADSEAPVASHKHKQGGRHRLRQHL